MLIPGRIHGLPAEDTPELLALREEAARKNAAQVHYNHQRAARAARWLRERPKRLPMPWADYCREVLEEDAPGWIDFLIDNEAQLKGKGYTEARSAQERYTDAARVTTGEVRPAHRVKESEVCNLHTFPQGERARRAGISRRTQIKLDRLARERPDLLEEVREGRLSAHGAAKVAGFEKDPTTLEKLTKLWAKATPGERRAFLLEVTA